MGGDDMISQTRQYQLTTGYILTVFLVGIFLLVPVTIAQAAEASLLAQLHFEEGAGNPIDSSPHNARVTNTGATWVNDGKFGKALAFDGQDDAVVIEPGTELNTPANLTISMWVNWTKLGGVFAMKLGSWTLASTEKGKLSFFCYPINDYNHPPGVMYVNTRDNAVQTNHWYHIVVRFRPAEILDLYVDDKLIRQTKPAGVLMFSGPAPIVIGAPDGNGNDRFAGRIDEVEILNCIAYPDLDSGMYVFGRFFPSQDRLAVKVNCASRVMKLSNPNAVRADITVLRKEAAAPLLHGTLSAWSDFEGTWRTSAKTLPEGEYTVEVILRDEKKNIIARETDWFEKRNFDWMVHPRGIGAQVPAPFTPLTVSGKAVKSWGRSYRFAATGLPNDISSQDKSILSGAVSFQAEIGNAPIELKVSKPFAFTSTKPDAIVGSSTLEGNNLKLELRSRTEYDGFTLFSLQYGPQTKAVTLSRLRVRIPIRAEYAKFYSVGTDNYPDNGYVMGQNILAGVLPEKEGKIYDSKTNTHSVFCSPTFATLFWVGDHDISFCYAADSDKGWVIRDDAPAVEAYREGNDVVLWLNLVDKEVTLTAPRALEFALQAGPTKPLPAGWRGLQDFTEGGALVGETPLTLIQTGSDGHTMAGGMLTVYPGDTPELQQKSRERLEQIIAGGGKAVIGYQYVGTVPKGVAAARVFRGEWGIDKRTWDSKIEPDEAFTWENRFCGDNKDLYIYMYPNQTPSYTDFLAYATDEAFTKTPLAGYYHDMGFPRPVYDEELGLGYTRDDGLKVFSSGLWGYRECWKRMAYVSFQRNKPNYLRDSQHVFAHFMPAYNFIGIWAPCESGYYNTNKNGDNLDFYGSIEGYAAYNPAKQTGQIPMVGMSSPRTDNALLFAGDTRCMMMLALLHDQDVGCFGKRDARVVIGVRHARNLIKPWEKEVTFHGYWENAVFVKSSTPEVKVSLYQRPDSLLVVAGNVDKSTSTVVIEPAWRALQLSPEKLRAVNAETGELIPRTAGNNGFQLTIPAHDLRLILLEPSNKYYTVFQKPGEQLPAPRVVLQELSDSFSGPTLSANWQQDIHTGASGVWMIDGRLCIQGAHYGYAHIRRELGIDNISVQCLVMRRPSGGMDVFGGGLNLYWANGASVQAIPGTGDGKFLYLCSGAGQHVGSPTSQQVIPGWYPYYPNWVKIVLSPTMLEFYSSSDGTHWIKDWEVQRDANHSGAPQYVILGNGQAGKEPFLNNPDPRYFEPNDPVITFYSDLIVGKE